jgi:8-oxo-dGTP diphosphatase
MPAGEEMTIRCSAVVLRRRDVLLVRRTTGRTIDWVLPGGTPRRGESLAVCAAREVQEETGLTIHPVRVAYVLETMPPDGLRRTIDVVFAALEPPIRRRPAGSEPGLQPVFVPVDRLTELELRPPLADQLHALASLGMPATGSYLRTPWLPGVHHHSAPEPTDNGP